MSNNSSPQGSFVFHLILQIMHTQSGSHVVVVFDRTFLRVVPNVSPAKPLIIGPEQQLLLIMVNLINQASCRQEMKFCRAGTLLFFPTWCAWAAHGSLVSKARKGTLFQNCAALKSPPSCSAMGGYLAACLTEKMTLSVDWHLCVKKSNWSHCCSAVRKFLWKEKLDVRLNYLTSIVLNSKEMAQD